MLSAKKLAGMPPPDVEAATVRASDVVWVTPPKVPERVMVDAAAAADEFTLRVRVLCVDVLFGLNDAVTPEGRFEAERTTGFDEFVPVTVTIAVPVAPCSMVRVAGETDSENPPTVRLILTVEVRPLEVPVTVMMDVPVAAELEAASVSELVLVGEAGLKVAVTPEGRPDAERATDPSNPPDGTTVRVSEPCEPSCTLRLVDEGDRLKLGGGAEVMFDGELLHAALNAKRAATASGARNCVTNRERRLIMAF